MKIIIVRHAQVKKNLQSIDFHDSMQGDLTEEGRQQAIDLITKLDFFDIKKIFVSQSPRTIQTARLIADKNKIAPIVSEKINEVNFGIFSNLSINKAKEKFPDIYQVRAKGKYNYRLPEGESFADAGDRWNSFFTAELNKDIKGDILIITHATMLKIFFVKFLGKKMEEADKVIWHNTSYLEVDWDGNEFKLVKICQ